jgi:5-methylcytosine-specific restriction endonuclease McrA
MARIRSIKRSVTAEERRQLARRYGCVPGAAVSAPCRYCGAVGIVRWVQQARGAGWVQFSRLEIEHVIPEYLGGLGGDNLDLACLPCNRAKGPRTPEQWRPSANRT